MKKKAEKKQTEDIRPHYDFATLKGGVRGKYADQYKDGRNVVLLEPDVASVFHNERAVNEALRSLMRLAKQQIGAL